MGGDRPPASTSASPPKKPAMTAQSEHTPTPLNMGHMVHTIPNPPLLPSPHQYFPGMHAQHAMSHLPPMAPYLGQNPGEYHVPRVPPHSPYGMPYVGFAIQQAGAGYQPYVANQPAPGPGLFPTYGSGYYPQAQYAAPYEYDAHPTDSALRPPSNVPPRRTRSSATSSRRKRKELGKLPTSSEYDVLKTIVDGSNSNRAGQAQPQQDDIHSSPLSISPNSGTPRVPPRKPKQSGHALWVGNLPTGTNVIDLKEHFSQDATESIESVFLISKSNCAFVNYKSTVACAAALQRFHDSKFRSARLVCRLRNAFSVPRYSDPDRNGDAALAALPIAESQGMSDANSPGGLDPPLRMPERYFILKSLTVEDLELSKQSGVWATQTHNEAILNRAYEASDNVFLIFSANNSGEYFGYARMMTPIHDDEVLALEAPTHPEPSSARVPNEQDVVFTPATATAPKGRIIEDPARGTIFWEVESSSDDQDDTRSEPSAEEEGQLFGKPFRIQWLSTERVAFHRTRGLRNPWNANREVKIARDGTEIEPAIGRQLVQLFPRP